MCTSHPEPFGTTITHHRMPPIPRGPSGLSSTVSTSFRYTLGNYQGSNFRRAFHSLYLWVCISRVCVPWGASHRYISYRLESHEYASHERPSHRYASPRRVCNKRGCHWYIFQGATSASYEHTYLMSGYPVGVPYGPRPLGQNCYPDTSPYPDIPPRWVTCGGLLWWPRMAPHLTA